MCFIKKTLWTIDFLLRFATYLGAGRGGEQRGARATRGKSWWFVESICRTSGLGKCPFWGLVSHHQNSHICWRLTHSWVMCFTWGHQSQPLDLISKHGDCGSNNAMFTPAFMLKGPSHECCLFSSQSRPIGWDETRRHGVSSRWISPSLTW